MILYYFFVVFQTYAGLQETLGGQWRTYLDTWTLGAEAGDREHRTQKIIFFLYYQSQLVSVTSWFLV